MTMSASSRIGVIALALVTLLVGCAPSLASQSSSGADSQARTSAKKRMAVAIRGNPDAE